jgi:hypothetical protein
MGFPGGDKVDEGLCLGTEGGLEQLRVVTERLNGASGDELCGAATVVYLTGEEADGRWRTKSDVLLGEPGGSGKQNTLY